MARFTRGLTRETYVLSFTSLFADISTEMLYPVLPIFVTEVLGASAGTLGGIELCQVAVTLTFATSRGHALIGRALYLPEGCAADEEHRELAGVPEEVLFATKPQLAGDLLDHAHGLGIRAAFVAGDEVYGGRQLRRSIRQRGMGYVLAVRANHVVSIGPGRAVTAAAAARLIPARAWQRMRTGSGTKGTRHYGWAMLQVASDDTPDGHGDGDSVLLVRRRRYTGTLSYYRCWTPGPVPLSKLIVTASARWRIEEDHQLSKQNTGLDAGQVIRWKSWHRWTAICLLAYLYLAVAVAFRTAEDWRILGIAVAFAAVLALKEYARAAFGMSTQGATDFARNLHATVNSYSGMRA